MNQAWARPKNAKGAYACVVRGEVLFLSSAYDRAVRWCKQHAADTHTPEGEIRLFHGDMNDDSRRPHEAKWNERHVMTEEESKEEYRRVTGR